MSAPSRSAPTANRRSRPVASWPPTSSVAATGHGTWWSTRPRCPCGSARSGGPGSPASLTDLAPAGPHHAKPGSTQAPSGMRTHRMSQLSPCTRPLAVPPSRALNPCLPWQPRITRSAPSSSATAWMAWPVGSDLEVAILRRHPEALAEFVQLDLGRVEQALLQVKIIRQGDVPRVGHRHELHRARDVLQHMDQTQPGAEEVSQLQGTGDDRLRVRGEVHRQQQVSIVVLGHGKALVAPSGAADYRGCPPGSGPRASPRPPDRGHCIRGPGHLRYRWPSSHRNRVRQPAASRRKGRPMPTAAQQQPPGRLRDPLRPRSARGLRPLARATASGRPRPGSRT